MYSRSYPNPAKGSIPPNYSGNAFDLAREKRGQDRPVEQTHPQKAECTEKECRPTRQNPLGAFLSRRDGKRIEGDDILLAGLIVLLLTSGADEELILILGFLFLVGL